MHYLPALLTALFASCVVAGASALDSSGFKGDRIVIFRDDSDAFAAFERDVLRDSEVTAFMNQNFAVYTVETGSLHAQSMPHLAGGRDAPRTVIVSPRLDNMASVVEPTLNKERFLALLQAVSRAQTREDVVVGVGAVAGPTAEEMKAWARELYPAITEPGSAPADLLIGFLISRDMKVLQHSVAIGRFEGPVLDHLRRMLPRAALPERPVASGASCFGGYDAQYVKYSRYCVTWALAPE